MPPDERMARLEVRVDHLHDTMLRLAGQIESIDLKMDRLIVQTARMEVIEQNCHTTHNQANDLRVKLTRLETWVKVSLGIAAVGGGATGVLSFIFK